MNEAHFAWSSIPSFAAGCGRKPAARISRRARSRCMMNGGIPRPQGGEQVSRTVLRGFAADRRPDGAQSARRFRRRVGRSAAACVPAAQAATLRWFDGREGCSTPGQSLENSTRIATLILGSRYNRRSALTIGRLPATPRRASWVGAGAPRDLLFRLLAPPALPARRPIFAVTGGKCLKRLPIIAR
jgi:hypothetical protein